MKNKIEVVLIPQVFMQVKISDHNGLQVGYCVVSIDDDEKTKKRVVTLWHIYVSKTYRRKGYAKTMVDFIKSKADIVTTGATSREGAYLISASGFKQTDTDRWHWENPVERKPKNIVVDFSKKKKMSS